MNSLRTVAVCCVLGLSGALTACEPADTPDGGSKLPADAATPDAGSTDSGQTVDSGTADAGSKDAGTASTCPAGWVCPKTPLLKSQIGAWYSLNYKQNSGVPTCPANWAESRYRPVRGYYDTSSAATVDQHFAEMRKAGIDFLVLDFTNGISPDPAVSHIYKSGETVMQRNLDPAAPVRMPFALAIGAQLWAHRSSSGQDNEANFIIDHYVKPGGQDNAGYFRFNGKPLLVNYNTLDAPSPFLPNWTDARFHVGKANPVVSLAKQPLVGFGSSWWGWASEHPNNLASDVVTVSPGADNTHRCDCIGTIHYDRNGGSHAECSDCDIPCSFKSTGTCPAVNVKCSSAITGGNPPASGTWPGLTYQLQWLRAVKQNPRVVVIASYNDFGDETAIEPAIARTDGVGAGGKAPPWVDYYGTETPDWYMQITTAYANLRTGLQPGGYYRDEDSTFVYQVVNGALAVQSAYPRGHPITLLPAGTLRSLGATFPMLGQIPPEGTVIVAPNVPHAVVTRGVAVRFEVAATALKFGAPVTLTEAAYYGIPYAGTIRAQAPVFAAPGLPPAFESDLGELWEFDCLEAATTNGSHVNSIQSAAKFNAFAVRSGLHCKP